jgi:predicted metalloendopeptidase
MSGPAHPIDAALFDTETAASDDFYRHVNGGWLDANPVPPEYGAWGAGHVVHERNQEILHRLLDEAAGRDDPKGSAGQKVGDYFAAAMDEAAIAGAGVQPLEPYLTRIAAAGSMDDVRGIVRDLQRVGVAALHSLGVAPDFEDSEAYLVYLGQGGLGLPERDYYTRDDEQSEALRRKYVTHIARQLANLGVHEAGATDQAQAAGATGAAGGGEAAGSDGAAEAILAFETRLAETSYTAAQLRDVPLTMNRHDFAALDELMPAFGLAGYVRDLGVTSPTVNVDNPGFFRALDLTLAETSIETLRDYLRWHLVRTFAMSLTPAFEDEAFDFYGKTLGGQQEMKPRWKRALASASSDIGELVAQLYVEAAFSEQAKQRCEEMVDHLLAAMGRAIHAADWMSDATREEALRKLAGFTYKIGYPDVWRDYGALEVARDSFVQNRMRAEAFELVRQLGRLGQPVDRTEWEMPAHIVNAYYHPLLNEIVFPAGILQPPFFYADADDAVNYGAIGAIIGHEITHGFDDEGSHFDASGQLRDWWAEADRAEFMRRAEVLVSQFDGYEVLDGLHVNGPLTLGENIADLGGLKIAHDALLDALAAAGPAAREPVDGFTPEQRLFYSWATVWRTNYTDEYLHLIVQSDPHSPARARVNEPLANLPAFAAAFGIDGGSPMARDADSRADIW